MSILLNPVLLSVIVMLALCFCKVNIMLSILISALVGGLLGGFGLVETMELLIAGMGGNAETALSYVLLGSLAVAIGNTGIVKMLCVKLLKVFNNRRFLTIIIIAAIACLSQNLIPVHIAFIPILIPPLLTLFNNLKIDRRALACALTFGLKAPYLVIPAGFGLLFHGVVADAMKGAGLEYATGEVWKTMVIPALSMLIGLLIAIFISYRKPRTYEDRSAKDETDPTDMKMGLKHWLTIAGIVVAFAVQLMTSLLPLGALAGLVFMVITGVIKFKELDDTMADGMKMMGMIAFIMLVAAGYANVLTTTGGVDDLIAAITMFTGTNKLVLAFFMLLIGLIITMGIGTSFGTVPIIAVIYVPLALAGGFSPAAICCLIATAGALGDAGSPASDSTLGPTSGLNADGQHNHIYDTCLPTFLHYNIPLLISGTIAATFIL